MNEHSDGVKAPNFTSVPNELFDFWCAILSPAEFKVLMCICRKTFGWHKEYDQISIKQLEKISGLSRQGIVNGVESLIDRGLVLKIRSKTDIGDDAVNKYEINVNRESDVNCMGGGSQLSLPPVVNSVDYGVVNSVDTQKIYCTKERPTKELARNAKKLASALPVPGFLFSIDQGKFLGITEQDMASWRQLYPSISVDREVLAATEWCKANPTKAKLKRKWRQFLMGWFSRQEEKQSNKQAYRDAKNISVELPDDNKKHAENIAENYNLVRCPEKGCHIEAYSSYVEISFPKSAKKPIVIEYAVKGFKEQLESSMRKIGLL